MVVDQARRAPPVSVTVRAQIVEIQTVGSGGYHGDGIGWRPASISPATVAQADAVTYFVDAKVVFTPLENFAEKMVKDTLTEFSRLIALKIFAVRPQAKEPVIIASGAANSIASSSSASLLVLHQAAISTHVLWTSQNNSRE